MSASSNPIPFWKTRKFLVTVLLMLAGLAVHAWAIYRLPEDFDEPVYLAAASDYGRALRAGDLQAVIDYPGNREHPALVKLIYALPFVVHDFDQASPYVRLYARSVSATFGAGTVGLVAWLDPVAGALLVLHSLFTKYTSLAMLDALPGFTCLAAVLALNQAGAGRRAWLWVSAAALGLTVACKYTYALGCIPVAALLLQKRDIPFWKIVLYGLAALLVFWAANPGLWQDPVGRLLDSAAFHSGYAQSGDVIRAGFPWYQPFVWLAAPPRLYPEIAWYPALDLLISAAALPGLWLEGKRRPWITAWILAGLAILLAWPTKWPHYTLLISVPLCLAAAGAIRAGLGWGWRMLKSVGSS